MKDITFSNNRACEPKPIPYYIGCIKSRKLGIVPNSGSFNLPNDFNTTSAIDTWLHAIDDTITAVTYVYPPATSNPTSPINCTEVVSIQSWLDSLGIGITYTINNFDEIVLVYDNISEVNRWFFWLGGSASDSYTNKLTPTVLDVQTDEFTYAEVQVVKEYLDEEYKDRYFLVTDNPLQEVFFDSVTQRFSFGNCPTCRKEIFATHIKYLNLPNFLNIFDQDGDPVDATIFDTTYLTPINTTNEAYFVDSNFNNLSQIGLPFLNNFQDAINFVNSYMPLPQGTGILLSTTPNGTNGVYFIANSKCIPIQEIKEKDSCTGKETYRYVIEDGIGNLVSATDKITGFEEDSVLLSCPEPPVLLEKEVCGTINGSVSIYELIRIYTRNPTTGVSTTLFYEDNKGNQITGTVVETCCTCDTLCDVSNIIVPLPNQRCIGYSGNNDPNISASRWMISNRYNPANWAGTCGGTPTSFSWELFSCIVSGVELLTTPVVVTVPFASMTLTSSGIATNYATAFNALPELAGNDIVLDPDMVVYNWNTTKPFLLGFRQYTSDDICTPALTSRLEFIKSGISDGWDFAISSNLVDMQTKAMDIYNDPSINYPHQSVNSCVAI